jgi:hypothetical protein
VTAMCFSVSHHAAHSNRRDYRLARNTLMVRHGSEDRIECAHPEKVVIRDCHALMRRSPETSRGSFMRWITLRL